MRVLVAYGSKMGGTAEMAEWVAEGLRGTGHEADVVDGKTCKSIDGYDAVVVGGGLYANRWAKGARKFVKRHRWDLVDIPVWGFSSGPLNDDAAEEDLDPTDAVEAFLNSVKARGHRTFGGRLVEDPGWFPASSMSEEMAGDWRDRTAVVGWATAIGEELKTLGADVRSR